ncbi:MAG TPA: hypothetical protein VH476_09345 [Solirubrobacterales bacterium]
MDWLTRRRRSATARAICGASLSLAIAPMIFASPAHAAHPPRACDLFTRHLVEEYLNTDLERTTDTAEFCDYQSQIAELHRGGDLHLVTWRLASNARSTIAGICGTKGVTRLSIRGAAKACGLEGKSGLCIDVTPTREECQRIVKIYFRHGRTTGSAELATLELPELNNIHRAAALMRHVLARWH